jgi:hypothetical protein
MDHDDIVLDLHRRRGGVSCQGGFSRPGTIAPAPPESPEETVKRRYAKGEIDKAEFEQKRKDIPGS